MHTATNTRKKFFVDLDRGKNGEHDVFNILKRYRNVTDVIDVSDDVKYQNIEVDAIICYTDRPPTAIEIKTDFYDRTGNIVFEVFSSYERGTAGGFVKTQSDFILYYFPNTGILYSIETIPFKLFVLSNKNNLKYIKMGDSAMGFKIPIKTLEKQEWFKRVC